MMLVMDARKTVEVLLWFSAVACLASSTNENGPAFDLHVDTSDQSYSVKINGVYWLTSGESYVYTEGKFYTEKSLKLTKVVKYEGDDALGHYTATQFRYKFGSLVSNSAELTIRKYPSHNAVVFSQHYPNGLNRTSRGSYRVNNNGFPVFNLEKKTADNLGYIGYTGMFAGFNGLRIEKFNPKYLGSYGGCGQNGPLPLFDKNGNALIISSYSEFMSTCGSFIRKPDRLSWGSLGSLEYIPKGYFAETIMVYSNQGINDVFTKWGDLLRKRYGDHRDYRKRDTILKYLGYYTDNGAFYYQHPEIKENYQETLLNYLNSEKKLPYGFLQLDDWFYPIAKWPSYYGATLWWNTTYDKFPMGLTNMNKKVGLNFFAHNRFWSNETWYAKQNGGSYNFLISKTGVLSIPDDQRFWDDLFQYSRTWGLVTYEQDWMWNQMQMVTQLHEDPTLGRRWLLQMGRAAARKGLHLQYCMETPNILMQSLEVPAVSQARASGDYQLTPTNWKIGVTSLLLHALGIAPVKDAWWSVKEDKGSPKPYYKREPNPELQATVALLSTATVGNGDRIHKVNETLIKMTCTSRGLLLKPDRPILAINDVMIEGTLGSPIGEIYTTYTKVDEFVFGHLVGIDVKRAYHLIAERANIPFSNVRHGGKYWYWRVHGNPADGGYFEQSEKPLFDKSCTYVDFCYYVISPIVQITNGGAHAQYPKFVLAGEQGKINPFSKDRIQSISYSTLGVEVTLVGSPGEQVPFGVLYLGQNGDSQATKVYPCVINSRGFARLSLPSGICA